MHVLPPYIHTVEFYHVLLYLCILLPKIYPMKNLVSRAVSLLHCIEVILAAEKSCVHQLVLLYFMLFAQMHWRLRIFAMFEEDLIWSTLRVGLLFLYFLAVNYSSYNLYCWTNRLCLWYFPVLCNLEVFNCLVFVFIFPSQSDISQIWCWWL